MRKYSSSSLYRSMFPPGRSSLYGSMFSHGSMFSPPGRRRDKHCVVHRIDRTPLYFDVIIKSLNGIEPFRSPNTSGSGGGGLDRQCIYFVVLWLENPATDAAACSSSIHGNSSRSKEAPLKTHTKLSDSTDINVRWGTPQKFEFELDPAVFEWEKLKLEVVRIGFGDEIGSSGGERVVGRASINIRKLVRGKELSNYQVDLVRTRLKGSNFECRKEGRISIDMKLSREYRFSD